MLIALTEWFTKLLHDPVAVFTAVLAFSTIFLWIVTRKAAVAAKASADALITIERAYMFAEVSYKGFVSEDGRGDELHTEVKLWNYGKTPADITMIRGYIVVQNSAPERLLDVPGADRELP